MSRALTAATTLIAAAAGPARANQPDYEYDDTERVETWSWVSLLSALYAFDSEVPDQTSGVLGAQLRIRHGRARSDDRDDLKLWSFGIGVETVHFDTFEPQLLVGRHWLPVESYWWGGPFFADLRVDVGVGYAWSSSMTTPDRPFVTVKTGAGLLLSNKNRHVYEGRHGPVSYKKLRFRQQVDFVLETRIANDGEWRLGFGIELDLARLLTDLVSRGDFF